MNSPTDRQAVAGVDVRQSGLVPDSATFREAMRLHPTGVALITAREADGTPAGMVVGTFVSISLDPPLVGFFAGHGSTSWPRIKAAGSFCVNVLNGRQAEICRAFTVKEPDRFGQHSDVDASSGAPLINGASAYIDCDLTSVNVFGDHDLAVGQVREIHVSNPAVEPLLFFRGGFHGGRVDLIADLSETLSHASLVEPACEQFAQDTGLDVTISIASNGRSFRIRTVPRRVRTTLPPNPAVSPEPVPAEGWTDDLGVHAPVFDPSGRIVLLLSAPAGGPAAIDHIRSLGRNCSEQIAAVAASMLQ
jgi:3-hydroxy-9,10-secoandrosta-1,3,5(10)-triene-9,17-dione monooxygenase reductase component